MSLVPIVGKKRIIIILTYHEALIPIAAIMVALSVPFILRALDKGRGQTVTTTNVYNIKADLTNLEKRVDEGFKEVKRGNEADNQEYKAMVKEVYERFATIMSDIRLHGENIRRVEKTASDLEIRVREVEEDVIRIKRNGGIH